MGDIIQREQRKQGIVVSGAKEHEKRKGRKRLMAKLKKRKNVLKNRPDPEEPRRVKFELFGVNGEHIISGDSLASGTLHDLLEGVQACVKGDYDTVECEDTTIMVGSPEANPPTLEQLFNHRQDKSTDYLRVSVCSILGGLKNTSVDAEDTEDCPKEDV